MYVGVGLFFFHSSVCKQHKKRSGKGRQLKTHVRFLYTNLYDGLHAVSEVKKHWFNKVIQSFQEEVRYTSLETFSSSTSSHYEEILSSDSESDFLLDAAVTIVPINISLSDSDSELDSDSDIPWKRRK